MIWIVFILSLAIVLLTIDSIRRQQADIARRVEDFRMFQRLQEQLVGSVGNRHAAEVLEAAADDWDSAHNQAHLRYLANTQYQPGGPSMPVIWLRDRAKNLTSEETP